MNETRHRVLRSLLAGKFTARAAEPWRQVSEQIATEQIAALLHDGPPADLISAFALPVPLRLMCRLLGVPEQHIDFVRHQSQQVITRAYKSSLAATQDVYDVVDEQVRRSEASPGNDLIGQLITELLLPGSITRQELVDFAFVILVAGHTTTASTIGLSVLSLLEDPDSYRTLQDEPALAGRMVEEFLRLQTIVSDGLPRLAMEDLIVGGVTVHAGDAVIVSLASANMDEDVFADPETLEPHRAGVNRNIAFGWGPHRCIGQHLARVELQAALTTLARTIPTLRLAVPVEQVLYGQEDKHLDHLEELPVTW